MAFFDPNLGSPQSASRPVPAPARLDNRERDVLLLARADRPSSLRAPGRLTCPIVRAFGFEPPNRLADPRLEALRRFAVLLRHRGERLDLAEERRLRDAGFSEGQVLHVRRFVLGAPCRRRKPIDLRALVVAALLAPAWWGYQRLADWTADPLIGLILTLIGLSSLAPLATAPAPRRHEPSFD